MDKKTIEKLEKIHRIILSQSDKVLKLTSGNVSHDAKVVMATLMNICEYHIKPIINDTDDDRLINDLRALSIRIRTIAATLCSLTPSNVNDNVKEHLSASMKRYVAVIKEYGEVQS